MKYHRLLCTIKRHWKGTEMMNYIHILSTSSFCYKLCISNFYTKVLICFP